MKAPRIAHWRALVPALALGMALGPVRAHAAPAKPAGEAEAAPKGEGGEAPKGETAPKGKASKLPRAATGETPKGETTPKTETGEAPKGETGEAPKADEAAGGDAETPPETDAGASPDAAAEAGTTPSPQAEPTEPEAPPEPEITLQPRPVEAGLETSTTASGVASRDVVTDPRRVRSDDRILFRAGLLAFGVAGAALVPTVVGLQQGAYARRVLGRLDTPSEADARPEVQTYERTMNRMALVTGSVAVASIVAGALLVGLGARRGKPVPPALAPAVGPGTAGLVLRGRF